MRCSTLLLTSLAALAGATSTAQAFSPDEAWTRWSNGDAEIRSLDFTAPGIIHAGSDAGGVFVSQTAGVTWAAANGGLNDISAKSVRQVVSCGNTLHAGTSAGLFSKSTAGTTWVRNEKLSAAVQTIACPGGAIVAGTASGGIQRSTDSGQTWVKAPGLPPAESVWHIEQSGSVLYAAGGQGVYRSTDGGASWHLRSDGLPFGEARRVEVAPGNPAFLYAATSSGLYRSINFGETWAPASGEGASAIGNTKVRSLQLVPAGWAGADRLFAGTDHGVYATRDGGKSWAAMSADSNAGQPTMKNQTVFALGMNPIPSPAGLIAGTQAKGIYSIPFKPVLNTAAPAIDDTTPSVGQQLVASEGTWSGMDPQFFTFQWLSCTSKSNEQLCDEIDGATGSSYVVRDGDAGDHLRVRVTAKGMVPPDPAPKLSDATNAVVAGSIGLPTPPSGYPRLAADDGGYATQKSYPWGVELTAEPGPWTAGTTLKYQWQRCDENASGCADIPGATNAVYQTTADDAVSKLRVIVSGMNDFGGKTVTSAWTNLITEQKPANVQLPRIVGDAVPGVTLDSTSGLWKGRNISYTRTWQLCDADGTGCNAVPGGTGTTFQLFPAFKGKRVRLIVEASNAAGTQDDVKATSALTPVIADPAVPAPSVVAPPAVTAPAVTSPVVPAPPVTVPRATPKPLAIVVPTRLKVGAVLKAPALPAAAKVQWLRNGKRITRATKRSYRLVKADRGRRIALRITVGGKTTTTAAVKVPRR